MKKALWKLFFKMLTDEQLMRLHVWSNYVNDKADMQDLLSEVKKLHPQIFDECLTRFEESCRKIEAYHGWDRIWWHRKFITPVILK